MDINFVSSLTPEDESRFALALIGAMGELLDLLPIAYSIRIKTVTGKTLDRTHTPYLTPGAMAPAQCTEDVVPSARALQRSVGPAVQKLLGPPPRL